MQAKISSSVVCGIIVFLALVPMCFFIGNNKAVYLITANYSWLAWAAAVLAMALCAFFRNYFSLKQLTALCIFFVVVPLSFRFNGQHLYFVFMSHAPALATAYWSTALGLGIKCYKKNKTTI